MEAPRKSEPQASKVNFNLHTLGWEAFQNLCGHIAREVLGQTVTVFSSSGDAGQDGAFQGEWKRQKRETYTGRFILQCKFTSRENAGLTLNSLSDEIEKAERLAATGFCQTYLLITNWKLSGRSDLAIRKAFSQIQGLNSFDILGEEWITQSIVQSSRLRAYVPRVYGLGDLSQILDDRAYSQAAEILETWRDNLTKFVPTGAHEQSVRAVMTEGFVLLLGDPMAGKSTIAAALTLAAADNWNCAPIFIRHPNEIRTHWNPHEPRQLFWVDDAFGATQLDTQKALEWNSTFPLILAAIKKGAKFILTSRTPIYKSACRVIKHSSFPLFSNSQVTIQVENLDTIEKSRILYNHIRLGTQPKSFRTAIKRFLAPIAENPKFFPELAKRLGDPIFTRSLSLDHRSLQHFIDEPKSFLFDIIKELPSDNFAALALLFMRSGRLETPPKIDSSEKDALDLLGAGLSQIVESLIALDGSLVQQAAEDGEKFWKYRHPTVRDAMAMHVASQPHLLDTYLLGSKFSEISLEVVCGNIEIEGAKVHVPKSRYHLVYDKFKSIELQGYYSRFPLLTFLSTRCPDDFLESWMSSNPDLPVAILKLIIGPDEKSTALICRLNRLLILPEVIRTHYLQSILSDSVNYANPSILDSEVRNLASELEIQRMLEILSNELPENLERIVDEIAETYEPENDSYNNPSSHFEEIGSDLGAFIDYFDDGEHDEFMDALHETESYIEEVIKGIKRKNDEKIAEDERKRYEDDLEEEHYYRSMGGRKSIPTDKSATPLSKPFLINPYSLPPERSIFDDVDE